jgi:putative methionine-R-sulfoxide reductase with GAF domain
LTASAVADKKTVVANDAAADARYLETLGSTRAEIIAPVLDHDTGEIVGTIDVASDRAGAFTDRDVDFLEACARAAVALWNS